MHLSYFQHVNASEQLLSACLPLCHVQEKGSGKERGIKNDLLGRGGKKKRRYGGQRCSI